MLRQLLAAAATPLCAGHFAMNKPPTWLDPDGKMGMTPDFPHQTTGWRSLGCTGEAPSRGEEDNVGCISQWYSNGTFIPGEPTIRAGDSMLTFPMVEPYTRRNPWRAPGTAPVWSPCGVDGGNPDGCPKGNAKGDNCAPGGYGHGPDMRSFKKGNTRPAAWKVGGTAEVAFGITANHGGGYQYRLCPRPTTSYMDLTEKCFQRTPLLFVGSTQWLQYGKDEANRTAIPAKRTSTGTFPAGSQWTRNPVPACGDYSGGAGTDGNAALPMSSRCKGSQFPEPIPGVKGFYGPTPAYPQPGCRLGPWSIVDKVSIPADLPTGDYVLSFRIDCEQTSQIWQQCADVRLS